MALCGVCANECSDASSIKCTGKCGNTFHLHCVQGENEDKIKRSTKDWKCVACRSKVLIQDSVKPCGSTSDVLTKDFLIKVMEGFKTDVFTEMSSLRSDMNELSTSVQHVSDVMDAANTLMEDIKTKFADLQKENQDLKENNKVLNKEVYQLRERMRSLEQYSRVNNVEISGIPVTKDENICDLIEDVGAAIGVEVKDSDIAAAHRVPSFRNDREPPLIVQFTCRWMKEHWISKARQKKTLTARDINQHFPVKRVYVNDHLSPENKQFLTKLKQKAKDLGYKFVWCRDCKFFVRKSEGGPVKRINSYDDMDKLK